MSDYNYDEKGDLGDGGNTTIARAKLIDDSLQDLEILYRGSPNSRKGQHFGGRMVFDDPIIRFS